jgi:hypothetical protein
MTIFPISVPTGSMISDRICNIGHRGKNVQNEKTTSFETKQVNYDETDLLHKPHFISDGYILDKSYIICPARQDLAQFLHVGTNTSRTYIS